MGAVEMLENEAEPGSWLPPGPLTRDDLDRAPHDGRRYELVDGALVVTPAPSRPHQRAVGNLYVVLRNGCPADLEVMLSPFDVALGADTVLQPDLLVGRREDFTDRDLPVPPLLAVEVLSPSTRRIDLMLKWSRLEAAGCPSYWVIDTDTPSLIAWELRDGAYVQVAKVTGAEEFRAIHPFPATVVPADLIR